MPQRSTAHATFVIERTYDASPARVFAACSDPAVKARWFGDPTDANAKYELDFRVGGRERNLSGPPGGPVYTYEARYEEIVPDQRIVSTYTMDLDRTRISISVATLELQPAGAGTRLTYTEQGAFLDSLDQPKDREHGCGELLDQLGAELRRQTATV